MKYKNSQIKSVELHLRRFGKITSMEAIERYGATRLSGIIWILRRRGMNITTQDVKTKNKYGNYCCYAEYHYEDYDNAISRTN